MKTKWFTILGLLFYVGIVILPPIIHGYVYPNLGDDAAVYMNRIEAMGESATSIQYTGYTIAGYPMLFIRDTLGWSIDTQFLWFNFLA